MPTTPTKKMGFEGLLYHGDAGTTASTLITNCRDVNYENDLEMGDTSVRGNGTLRTKTSRPVARTASLSWTMLMKSNDTSLIALMSAARAGTVVALRVLPYTGGKGLDADCYISVSNAQPIGGEQAVTFTLKGFEDADRDPNLDA